MNLELINPLLHYAGALDDLEDILFEKEMRAFEAELDGFGFDEELPAKPVWGASPGTLKAKKKAKAKKSKSLARKRARVKALPKTVQSKAKLKVKKTAKKRRPARARRESTARR